MTNLIDLLDEKYEKKPRKGLSLLLEEEPIDIPKQRSFIEKLGESSVRGWEGTTIDLDMYKALIGRKTYAEVQPKRQAYYKKIQEDPITSKNILEKGAYSVAEMIPAMGVGLAEGKASAMAAAGGALALGQLGPQVGMPEEIITVPTAAAIGGTIGSMQFWYRQGAGELYGDLKDEGIEDNIARPIAHIGGALYGAIEFSQVDKLLPGSKLAAKKMITKPLKRMIGRMVAKYGANWIHEVGEEGIQEMIMSISKDVATNVGGKTNKAVGKVAGDALKRGWEAVKESAIPMLMLMSPGAAINTKKALKQQGIKEEAIPGKSVEEQGIEAPKPSTEALLEIPDEKTFKELKIGRVSKQILSTSIIDSVVKEVEKVPNLNNILVNPEQKAKIKDTLKLNAYMNLAPTIRKITPNFVGMYGKDPLSQVIDNALIPSQMAKYAESKGMTEQTRQFKTGVVETVERELTKYVFKEELTPEQRETYEKYIKDYPTINQEAEPGLLARTIATPDNFFRKIGLPHVYRLGVKFYKNYTADMRVINDSQNELRDQWQKELKVKGLDETKRNEELWEIADGKDILQVEPLSNLEQQILQRFRGEMRQLAIKDKVPVDRQIGDYIFHEIERNKAQQMTIFDAVLQNLEKAPKEVKNPSLFVREGITYGLKKDFWQAWRTRHKLSLRNQYFDPIANIIELSSRNLTAPSSKLMAKWFKHTILKQATNIDKALDESARAMQDVVKSLPVLKGILKDKALPVGQEGRSVLNGVRTMVLLGTMAFNYPLTIRNLLQPALTLSMVSEGSLIKAYTLLKDPNAQNILRNSVTALNRFPVEGVGEVFLQKLLRKGLYTYKVADQINVYVSYLGTVIDGAKEIAKQKNIDLDTVLQDISRNPQKHEQLLELADDVATASQVGYTTVEMPPLLWSTVGKTKLQFTSWTANYATRYQVENYNRLVNGVTSNDIKLNPRQRLRVLQGWLYQGILAYLLGKLGVTAARTFFFGPVLSLGPAPFLKLFLAYFNAFKSLGGLIIDPDKQAWGNFKRAGGQLRYAHEAFIPFSAITRKVMGAIFDPSIRNALRLVLPLRKAPKKRKEVKTRLY